MNKMNRNNNMETSLLSSIKGFSMAGVLAASGMMGGLALVLAELSKEQLRLEKRSESNIEVSLLSQKIRRIIYNQDSCTETIGIGTGLTTGSNIQLLSIKNSNGIEIFKTSANDPNVTYGNNLIKIDSLLLRDINITGTGTNKVAEMNLQIVFEKVSRAVTGYNLVNQTYPLSVELNASDQVQRCTSNLSAAIAFAYSELCTKMGGTYNPPAPPAQASCTNPFSQPCPNGIVTSFDNNGTPNCQESVLHPVGRNCYLKTDYDGDLDSDPNLSNYNPISSATPTELNQWKHDRGPAPPNCKTGEMRAIFNPLTTIDGFDRTDGTAGKRKASRASEAFMVQYCCR